MCGFVGKLGNQPSAKQIFRALELLKDRGPDGHGVLSNETISLLHTRPKIIDLSDKAAQPLPISKTGCSLVLGYLISLISPKTINNMYNQIRLVIVFVWEVLNMDIFLRSHFPDFSTK